MSEADKAAEAMTVPPSAPPPPITATADATADHPQGPAPRAEGRPNLPDFEILEELGRGGMGVVYKARQISLNRLVALKMILAGPYAGGEHLARFRTEAEAVASLQHAGIVQIHEIGDHDGRSYLALEYVPGGTLARKCADGPLPADEAARLIESLARSVQYAHSRGVIHRDLKPGNVLLTEDGQPKIADFGLAKRLEIFPVPGGPSAAGVKVQDTVQAGSLTQTGAILGTPSYMAPEQAGVRRGAIGPAADVYALGAILYELLTGRPPFHGDSQVDVILQVVSDDPAPPRRLQPSCPPDLEAVCLKCLQKSPPARYASAGALAKDLRRFLAGEATLARPMTGLQRTRRWLWRRRWPLAGAVVAACLLLVLTWSLALNALAVFTHHEDPPRPDESLGGNQPAVDTQPQSTNPAANVREAAAQMQSLNNLKQLVLAMHNYHDTYDHLPTAAITDKDGKPLLSWRVAILPYIEQLNLYNQFKLDEPWDGPNNKKLLEYMPRTYAPPTTPLGYKPNTTYYQVFTGEQTLFPPGRPMRFTEVTDGTSNTIMILEAGEAVPWTKPDDLPYDPARPLPMLGGIFHDGFQAAFADGKTGRYLSRNIDPATLRALITPNGGEIVNLP